MEETFNGGDSLVVILVAALMLVYYCEFTDTFRPVLQGFVCRDPDLSKPYPGPEQSSRVQPVILYSVVLVVYVVHVFRESPEMIRSSSDNTIHTDEQVPHIDHADEDDKYIMATTPGSFNEVT